MSFKNEYKNRCKCGKLMTDLTHGHGEVRNFICYEKGCKRHYYNATWYTVKEWDDYVNNVN